MLGQRLEHVHFVEELLVALGGFLRLVHPALHHVQIRHDQLHVDGLDVSHRVYRDVGAGVRHHVHDILIVEAADHMDDGIGFPDVGQKLVAKPRALTGALHQTGDVHELNDRRGLFIRLIDLRQLVQPGVRHGHHAYVGVDGAERIVGALCACIGDGVEQGALSYVRKPHDT